MNGFILHLQGPMMSFADTGFGQLREAGPFPSRSVVIGLIAAASGVERGSDRLLELHRELRVHVATARSGSPLVDYHTVLPVGYAEYDPARLRRPGLTGNPILTDRAYHLDAHFVALICGDNPAIVDEAREALREPVFAGYLGRRCCVPATPLLPEEVVGATVIDALSSAARQAHRLRVECLSPWERDRQRLTFVDAFIDGESYDQPKECSAMTVSLSKRRDLLNAVPRYYASRTVTHARIAVPPDDTTTTTTEEYFDAAP